jgi:chemotaxis signal transduction protein
VSAAHLLVRVGETTAALPAAAVRRVVRSLRLHPLPGAGEGLLGLAEFAGEPLAVLDLARLMGAAGVAGATPAVTVVTWIGTAGDRELVGLAVDEALEVAELDAAVAAAGAGELLVGERPVQLLDLERLGEEP